MRLGLKGGDRGDDVVGEDGEETQLRHALEPVVAKRVVMHRSNIYDCLCCSCARGDDRRDTAHHFQYAGRVASGTCSTSTCRRITCGGKLCLACSRTAQRCMLCGALLEIEFVTIAKFKSFARFPPRFRQEARWLLMACRPYGLSRDVRVLLVRALSKYYHRPADQGPLLFQGETKDFARVEICATPQSGRLVVNVFNCGATPLSLGDGIRIAQRWTLTGGGGASKAAITKKKPDWLPVLPELSVAPGCGYHATVNLHKYFHMQIDAVRCVTSVRDRNAQPENAFDPSDSKQRSVHVEFDLKL